MSLLSIEEARQRILDDLKPLSDETVALSDANGRVATEAVPATRALPAFDNSAMDGYAVRAEDTAGAPETMPVTETIAAGSVASTGLAARSAMRIFTGAPMPAGADSVVMQENTTRDGDSVTIQQAARLGDHVRRAGEDVAVGQVVLAAGQRVRPGEIGMLAAQGRSWLRVVRRPRVAILPTGDEVIPIDRPLQPGQIANSNLHMLSAQVADAGGIPVPCPVAADDPAALAESLRAAAAGTDLILTCGGVSVGDFDHVRSVLGEHGRVDFWKVAIKPGKPLAYGRLSGLPLIGLPGNPVSSFVTFEIFVRPALRAIQGRSDVLPRLLTAKLSRAVRSNRTRVEYVRGRTREEAGELVVEPLSKQGSGQLTSILEIDALIEIPMGGDDLPAGAHVRLLPLS